MIGTLIGGTLGLIGAAAGRQNNIDTNRANYEIARMNNQFNEKMFERQMHYNTEMWNAQNRYNDPAAQVERLKNAGLNPYMMLDGGSAGIAQGANGVNPPTAQAATMQPFQGYGQFAEMVMRGLDYDLAKAEKKEQIRTMQQQRQIDFMDSMNRLIHSTQDLRDKQTINEINKIALKYAEDNQVADLRAKEDAHYIAEQELRIKTSEAAMSELTAAKLPQKLASELALMSADYAMKVAQGKLHLNSARTEYFKQAEISARSYGIRLDNNLKKVTFDASVDKAKYDAYHSTAGGVWSLAGRTHQKIHNILGW